MSAIVNDQLPQHSRSYFPFSIFTCGRALQHCLPRARFRAQHHRTGCTAIARKYHGFIPCAGQFRPVRCQPRHSLWRIHSVSQHAGSAPAQSPAYCRSCQHLPAHCRNLHAVCTGCAARQHWLDFIRLFLVDGAHRDCSEAVLHGQVPTAVDSALCIHGLDYRVRNQPIDCATRRPRSHVGGCRGYRLHTGRAALQHQETATESRPLSPVCVARQQLSFCRSVFLCALKSSSLSQADARERPRQINFSNRESPASRIKPQLMALSE